MEIIYTLHAEEQIKERKFEKVWIEETIKFLMKQREMVINIMPGRD